MWLIISAFLMALTTVLTALFVGWDDSTVKRVVAGVMAFPAVLFFALVMKIGWLSLLPPVALG